MIVLVDNYDSFSYNLYQLIGTLAGKSRQIKVVRNDEMSVDELLALNPGHIVISPGPGRPDAAGIIEDLVKEASGSVPILGVCLGHQAICEAFGAVITYAAELMHGKQKMAKLDNACPIFEGLPGEIPVARYHSLAVDDMTLPDELKVCARTGDGEVMAVMHEKYPTYGLQFHPESIMTPMGDRIMRNFLKIKL